MKCRTDHLLYLSHPQLSKQLLLSKNTFVQKMSSDVLVRRELARHSVGIAGIAAPNVCQDVPEIVPQFLVHV
jgi:hypothetical protein